MNEIVTPETAPHYVWGMNCQSWVFVDSEGLSVKRERMPAGASEVVHFHQTAQQFFYLLRGTATMVVGKGDYSIREGQGLLVPAKTTHCIANNTAAEIEFLVVSQPTTNNDRVNVEEASATR